MITAVFVLLLLSMLAAMMVRLISTSHVTSAEDVLGARAYQAARGGVEWALYQVLDPNNTTASAAPSAQDALIGCFPNGTPIAGLGANVSADCSSSDWQEGSKRLRIYRIVSRATLQGPGLMVERQVEATVEKCRDSAAAAPYDC